MSEYSNLEDQLAVLLVPLALLFVADRGPNAPLGLWAASFAGTPYGGAAFKAAGLVKDTLDAKEGHCAPSA